MASATARDCPATGGMLPPPAIRPRQAAQVRRTPKTDRAARRAFQTDRRVEARHWLKHGADEIADIAQGADLARLLPSELVKLVHPTLRLAFMQHPGNVPRSNTNSRPRAAPARDRSWWLSTRAVPWRVRETHRAMAPRYRAWIAQRERRTFALLGFDCCVKLEAVVQPGDGLPEEALFTGRRRDGDQPRAATRRSHPRAPVHFRNMDIVLITDGGSDTSSALRIRDAARDPRHHPRSRHRGRT